MTAAGLVGAGGSGGTPLLKLPCQHHKTKQSTPTNSVSLHKVLKSPVVAGTAVPTAAAAADAAAAAGTVGVAAAEGLVQEALTGCWVRLQ